MATSESLMFDGNRVQEEQEEQLKLEEDERQQQLKDLLANAFDDIDADETCSLASDESHDSGRHSDEIGQQQQWQNGRLSQHASTPVSETRAPPLITPMIQRRYSSPATSTTGHYNAYQKQNTSEHLHQEPDHTAMVSYDSNLTQQSEADSATAYHQVMYQHSPGEYYRQQYPTPNQTNGSYPPSQTSHHSGSDHSRGQQYMHHSPHCHPQQQQQPEYHQFGGSQERIQTYQQPQGYAGHSEGQGYVEAQNGGSGDLDNTVFAESEPQAAPNQQLQDRYFQEGPGAKNTQLEILYQAKGRQLQELQEKFELLQLESAKEIRVLRHQVALLEGEKKGSSTNQDHLQSLLTQNKEARFDLKKKLDSVQAINQELETEQNQLREQLESAEASIESLNAQIFALGSTDTIERMREQHENIITSFQQEQAKERNELNTQIACMKSELDQQTESITTERLKLKSDLEIIARERLDHGETINRLTNSLKESQKQVQELLNDTCGSEMSRLKIQLQQSMASKSVTEQLCDTLQKEMSDLKEQISLYETARNAEVFMSTPLFSQQASAADSYDDTLAELGIKPLNNKSSGYGSSISDRRSPDSEETILILRRELQKCLSVVKDKRAELSSLRSELDQKRRDELRAEADLDLTREKLANAQVELKEASIELTLYKSAAKDGNSLLEIKLKGQLESMTKDRYILQEEIKSLTDKLELIATNEGKLEEINAELSSKMSEMVDDFDRDKQAALDRCQQTLESHNQTVREMMRSELESEFDIKLKRYENHYQSELTRLRSCEKELTAELTQVKDLYVQVCSEKSQLEEKLSESQQAMTRSAKQDELESQLQKRITELEGDIATLTAEKSARVSMIEKLQQQLDSCRQENNSDKDRSKEQLGDLTSSLSACRELFTDNQSHERTKSNNQSQIRSGRSSANCSREDSSTRDQMRNRTSEQLNLHQELTEVNKQVTTLEKEISQLKVIISDLRADNEKLDKLLSAERIQLSLAKDDVVTLQQQVSDLKLTQADDHSLTDRLQQLTEQLGSSKKTVTRVQAELRTETQDHDKAKQELETLRKGLAAEKEGRSQAKQDLERVRKNLATEKDCHNTARKNLLNVQNDLQTEKKAHQLLKIELDKREASLHSEMTNHNQSKIDLNKLRSQLSEERANKSHSDSMDKTELIKLQAELESERRAQAMLRQDLEKLETSITTEKTSQSLALNTIESLTRDLDSEKSDHQQARQELVKIEAEFEAERANHNKTKIDLVTLEAELSTERANQAELRRSLEKVKTTHSENEVQLEVMRSNSTKDSEIIAQLKCQKNQDKTQFDGLRASHSQVLAELNDAKAELIRKSSELGQLKTGNSRLLTEIDQLTEKHSKEKCRIVEQHAETLKSSLEEAEQHWSQTNRSLSPDMTAENKLLKEKINSLEAETQNYEDLLTKADEHFEQQLNNLRSQMESDYKETREKLSARLQAAEQSLDTSQSQCKSLKTLNDTEKKQLKQEIQNLTCKLSDLEGKCKEYQVCTDELRRNLQSMSAQSDLLKSTNKKLQSELSKVTSSQDNKLEALSQQLQYKNREMTEIEHEHELTVQSLKQKMIALRNEQSLNQGSNSRSCQTPAPDHMLRQQYESILHNVRGEVLKYVEETNKNAAKLIKNEIHKAKYSTAKQLRNYYVKCFKDSMNDHRSSKEEKLTSLEKTLENAIAAVVTPTNINTDSILCVPEQLLNESLRSLRPTSRATTTTSNNNHHLLSDVYSRVDVTQSDRGTPTPTQDSRYSYVPLRHASSASRAKTPITTDTSSIIRELGLDNTETSPPRWYNPPPERLDPSPSRREYLDNRSRPSKFVPMPSANR